MPAVLRQPDGRWVYYARGSNQPGLFRVSVEGGPEEVVLRDLEAGFWGNWAIRGDTLFFLRTLDPSTGFRAVIRTLDLKTKAERDVLKIRRFPARFDTGLALSPDGRELLFAQLDRIGSDLFLLEGFR
jgi:Tol biopolymer transport system component